MVQNYETIKKQARVAPAAFVGGRWFRRCSPRTLFYTHGHVQRRRSGHSLPRRRLFLAGFCKMLLVWLALVFYSFHSFVPYLLFLAGFCKMLLVWLALVFYSFHSFVPYLLSNRTFCFQKNNKAQIRIIEKLAHLKAEIDSFWSVVSIGGRKLTPVITRKCNNNKLMCAKILAERGLELKGPAVCSYDSPTHCANEVHLVGCPRG
ncbi:unnamed protein product [Heligmosomoides polygyrus]|uniref:Transmembrane protein n=1 Tax=Heligmosomoides polygyrus TaxID=6339 RepID=A0A183FH96_HELPZ|nr:unnamed protein product [Heligmosomoides polygyrus]